MSDCARREGQGPGHFALPPEPSYGRHRGSCRQGALPSAGCDPTARISRHTDANFPILCGRVAVAGRACRLHKTSLKQREMLNIKQRMMTPRRFACSQALEQGNRHQSRSVFTGCLVTASSLIRSLRFPSREPLPAIWNAGFGFTASSMGMEMSTKSALAHCIPSLSGYSDRPAYSTHFR